MHRSQAQIKIPKEDTVDWQDFEPPSEVSDLLDALMCTGIALPPGPTALGWWTTYPHWVPFYQPSERHESSWFSSSQPLPQSSAQQAKSLFNAFHTHTRDTQAHLRLVMDRLSRMHRQTVIDAAVDLGIALEALYLNDLGSDRGELTFRLKIRAARFLESDPANRKKLFDLVGKVYALRSTAVHTGKLKGQPKPRQLLNEGFRLGVATVRQFIIAGQPNWDEVQFS